MTALPVLEIGGTHVTAALVDDADAFGLGEARYGAGRGHDRTVCVTVGTGVGSALVSGGRVVKDGPEVPEEGYAYRLTWGGRPLEETVSARAIRRRYAQVTGSGQEVRGIADRARTGGAAAQQVLGEAFAALGECLGPWVARFGATAFVLGGSIAGAFDLVQAPLCDGLARGSTPGLTVAPAALPDTFALLGAAHHADEQSRRAS